MNQKDEKEFQYDSEDDITLEEEGETSDDALKKLREKLKACQKEKQEYLDGWQRAKADLVNRSKAFEDERRNIIRLANEDLVTDLVAVLDSFNMAFSNKEAWEKIDPNWRKGVEYIHDQFVKILEEYGLEVDEPIGKHFDPNLHDSVDIVKTSDLDKDGIISAVIQKGYVLNGKVIRHAKVKVYEYKS